jgi:hypothetical protein
MTPVSRYRPLLDIGSLRHISVEMFIPGDLLGTERAFHVIGINNDSMDMRDQ